MPKNVSVDKEDAGSMEMLKVKVANGENVNPGTWLHKSPHRDWQIEDSDYWEQGDCLLTYRDSEEGKTEEKTDIHQVRSEFN